MASLSHRAIPALLALSAVGCGDEVTVSTYVGKVTGPSADAVVGLVSDGERVQLYLCGGPSTYATHSRWFQGPVAADGSFSIESGGFVATGGVSEGSGELKTDAGETLSWTARPASGDLEGLYAAFDGSCRTGAVVGDFDGDGTVDLQGTWCDGRDAFAQVTPIMPIATSSRGIGVRVQLESEPQKKLFVDRVRAP